MPGQSGLLLMLLAAPALAQLPLTPENQRAFAGVFDKRPTGGPLNCRVETHKPFLDFSFRYEIGYLARCPLAQFQGKQTVLGTVLRITPENGKPTLLGQSFPIPAAPAELRDRLDFKHLHHELEFSGVFAAGEGKYQVELTIFDQHNRTYRKRWQAEAHPHGNESQAIPAIRPETVAAISLPPWNGTSENGFRLSVLLDAAPINSHSMKLRAWDRAFLLGALTSVLRHLSPASVRLIAFNLDQQAEFFREEDFDHTGLYRLANALNKLELGAVSYKTLAHQEGWAEILARLVRDETMREPPSDAVIFLGPTIRMSESMSPYLLDYKMSNGIPFFYLEYFPFLGSEFPDTIQSLVSLRGGTTFKLHSPGDLAQAIQTMQSKLQRTAGNLHYRPIDNRLAATLALR
jgi:hypothetical protein